VERTWLFAHYDEPLLPETAERYLQLILRRMRHEPVAYLVGRKEFYGLDLLVDRRVLIPRPETELLVDAVLDIVQEDAFVQENVQTDAAPAQRRWRMADVGAGSGAIALAVACNAANVSVYAIDLIPDALAVARSNVERLDERRQITLLQGDLLAPLPERVDLIVANLPYISSGVYMQLDAAVRDYEPRQALEAGDQGLDAIARLLQQAPNYLCSPGKILLEIGYDQGQAVLDLARQFLPQARSIWLEQDYRDLDRIVKIEL
jgi:release factor glutamine methyltransferase